MNALAWKPVGLADIGGLAEARRQAHNAAQWLVRMAHSFLPKARGDGHTLLHWDADREAMVTQEFLPNLTLELRLPGLAMQFREGGRPVPHVFAFDDRTPAEAEAWILVELLHRQRDRDGFSKVLPYAFPDLMTGDAVPYSAEPLEPALRDLAAWYGNAVNVLRRMAEEDRPAGGGVADVVCWPDTFHIGILLPRDGKPGTTRMLRVGASPGEGPRAVPYFYVTPDNGRMSAAAPAPQILTASQLAASPDPVQSALEFLRAEIARHRAAA